MFKILIIEDHYELRELLKMVLSEKYEVIGYEAGENALEDIRYGRPCDLVISDFNLVRMNGIKVSQELLKLRPGLPILLMSANPFVGNFELPENVVNFLSKPFSLIELEVAIEGALVSISDK